jgi:hypothetical protein
MIEEELATRMSQMGSGFTNDLDTAVKRTDDFLAAVYDNQTAVYTLSLALVFSGVRHPLSRAVALAVKQRNSHTQFAYGAGR